MGDLHDYLAETGYAGRYMGVDIVPEFVEIAARKFDGNDRAEARCIDVMKEPLPEGCDYALLSGVFNNRMDDNRGFLEHTLRAMWTAAAKGIAFNALSTHVEYFDDALYYISPEEIFTFVKKTLGGHVRIRQDYVLSEGGYPYEFTVYAYKAPVVV
jgi:SAM-dependent methyltransferase